MDQLKELKNKLIEAQKPKINFRLSERTIVDIINKILDRNKINLLHTITGREYVTNEKIISEIESEIAVNKGRISLVELHRSLDLPMSLIEEKAKLLLNKNRNLNIIEGNLITNSYFDNVCEEIKEMLLLQGNLLISEIANRFDLSIDFFKNFLIKKVGSVIKAELHGTRLFTNNYINSQMSKIKPVLIASTFPVSLRFITEEYQVDDFIIDDLANKILNSGIVKGKLISGVFEPEIYYDCQASFVKGSLSQNNYIEYSKLTNIGIKDPRGVLKQVLQEDNGLFLKDYYINSNLIILFEGIFFDNYQKKMSTDITQIFPIELQDDDIHNIVQRLKIESDKIIIINQNIIPRMKVTQIIDNITPMVKEESSKQYNLYITKKNEREKKKREEEKKNKEEEAAGNDKKGGKKKPEKDKKKKGKNIENMDEDDKLENYLKMSEEVKIKLSELIKNSTLVKEEETNDKLATFDLLFSDYIFPLISEKFCKFTKEFIDTKSSVTNDPKNSLNQIETQFHSLQLMLKSTELLTKINSDPAYQSGLQVLIASVCKKELKAFYINVMTYQLIHLKKTIDVNRLSDKDERRNLIMSMKDDDLIQIFNYFNDCLDTNNLSGFISFLLKNCKNMAISIMPIDKKKEKTIIDRVYNEFKKLVDEKSQFVSKFNKKDFTSFLIDISLLALIKTNIYINVEYDITNLSAFQKLFLNANLISADTNTVLLELIKLIMLSEDEFSSKHSEIYEYSLKLLSTI